VEEIRPELWTAPHPVWHEQPLVRSYAAEREGVVVLIDPMSPPASLGAGRELRVALTCPWHARSAPELGLPRSPWTRAPASIQTSASCGSPSTAHSCSATRSRAGPVPDDWLPEGQTRADYRSWLLPLLALPVELVLPTHGDPGGRDLLELALAP
jgi:hypothetical protein